MTYLEAYAALTDEELAGLASAGLLRRARKLSGDVAEARSDAKGAHLTIGGHAIRVDGRGPAAVACECPTGGVCVHMVVAWHWARARAEELGVEPPAPAGPGESAPGPGAAGSGPGGKGPGGKGPGSAGEARGGAAKPRRRTAVAQSAAAKRASAKQVAAATRRAVALAEVRDAVVHLLDGGLAHLRDDVPELLRALAGRVRVAGFEPVHGLRLDALLRTAAGQAADLAAHADGTDESDILESLTELWALCEAHEHTGHGGLSGPSGAAEGRAETRAGENRAGRKRRSGQEEDEIDVARLVPLGVRWWTAPSGSRGLALAAWDPGAGRVRTAVTGRPAGSDPSFRREWEAPLLWGASPARLSDGPFSLTGVRARPDGTLGAGGSPRREPLGAFGLDELREVAERTGAASPARDAVGFGRRPSHVRLLLVRDTGEVGIDEVRQDLTWTVTDSAGQEHLLRVPVEDRRTADAILYVLAGRWAVVGVTAERLAGRPAPVGIFLRGPDGAIRLISPSLTEQYEIGRDSRWSHHHWETWRKRLSRVAGMRSRARAVTEVAEPDPPVARACGLAWDVLVSVAATGRSRLTPRQRADLELARTLARDLGLSTLERAVSDLVRDAGSPALTPEAVARTAFLVRRTREITTAA
ncbi:hypothetical protein [Myceligenerans pegani]|uniref:SWIM-type domain-containing protein n=1 Tax=Myceligenerans pegani TaxID=2776917 RepID=A0ABR9MS32_9MICO|nr:hypothetical protein [Myceligenerans sp. TRM 65318]MBE1874187.1 hypothetical protein [Myceligenerans sp. TRM 65318]MBE3016459.1 hypothetical protein [Myceligenerans sp. TRM 65318]